jgi:Na+/H+ antiporter NhaC
MSVPNTVESFLIGMAYFFPSFIRYSLAWALGEIMVVIGTDRLIASWIMGGVDPQSLPTLSFVISFLMTIATGTSFGTMAIIFPLLLVPTYQASNGDPVIFYVTTAGILSGCVAGEAMSPTSDTNFLASLSCNCDLSCHVVTQAPYALLCVIVSILLGTIPLGM